MHTPVVIRALFPQSALLARLLWPADLGEGFKPSLPSLFARRTHRDERAAMEAKPGEEDGHHVAEGDDDDDGEDERILGGVERGEEGRGVVHREGVELDRRELGEQLRGRGWDGDPAKVGEMRAVAVQEAVRPAARRRGGDAAIGVPSVFPTCSQNSRLTETC